ncbi:MAG: hypothetical protein ACYSSO_03575 [Planctomycetota bacterium]|jgi:hypothetical protein
MRTKKAVFLLPVFFCCCLALWLNSCKRKEVPTEKGPDLAKFNSYLKTQQETFKEEFAQVKKQYPTVALAFAMQEAAIAESMQLQKAEVGQLAESVVSLTGSTVISRELVIRLQECLKDLLRDLGRSQTYEDGLGAFDRFNQCRKR